MTDKDRDKHKLDCRSNPGVRGEPWEAWTEDWKEFARAEHEYQDDYSWNDVTEDQDQGGANGPAIPGGDEFR